MIQKVKISETLKLSKIVHGHWRLLDWNLSDQELLGLTQQVIDLGITSFDHADIYGNYECEKAFGQALALKPELRKDIQLITKCGIKLNTEKFPKRKIKYYDYSYDYIVNSVENSLNNFGTEYIDLLLLHRPAPFFNPEEVAKAFDILKSKGKVLNFGVSNFTAQQFSMLQSHVSMPLVTNQIEISPYCLAHFESGNIDFLLQERIKPMAWSPLAGGQIFNPIDEKGKRLAKELALIAKELSVDGVDKVCYAWLLKHPVGILPIVGSGNINRVKSAVEALNIEMSLEQWYRIYNASTGIDLP